MEKNPLEVLGLSRDIVRGLAPEQFQILIDGAYRTLAKIYHPDKSGGKKSLEKRARELFEAREYLDSIKGNPEALKRIQAEFSKPTPKQRQIESLEAKIRDLENFSKGLACNFIEYMSAFLGFSSDAPIFMLRSVEIGMNDSVGSLNRLSHGTPSMMYHRKTNFYQMLIDENGRVSKKYQGGEIKNFPNRRLIGSTPGRKHEVNMILKEIGAADKVNKLIRKGSLTKIHGHEIYFESAIPFEYSANLIPLLVPHLRPDGYLISFDVREGNPFFVVEGLPTKEYFK